MSEFVNHWAGPTLQTANGNAGTATQPSCPRWCDGRHEADGSGAVVHTAVLARSGTVALSLSLTRDPAHTSDAPVIQLTDASGDVQVVASADAARLASALETCGRPGPLTKALRDALALLEA